MLLEIEQQAHTFFLGKRLNNDAVLFLSLPCIRQSTNHISIIPDYDQFIIDPGGIGDLVLYYSRVIRTPGSSKLSLEGWPSMSTGTIEKKGVLSMLTEMRLSHIPCC